MSRLSGIFELVCTMLGIGRAENRSSQPVAPSVWIKEFPPFSRSPSDYGCDFGVWAGIVADVGDGQSQSITGTNAHSGPPCFGNQFLSLRFRSPSPVPGSGVETRQSKRHRFPSRKTGRFRSARFVSVGSQKTVRGRADGQVGGCHSRIRKSLSV